MMTLARSLGNAIISGVKCAQTHTAEDIAEDIASVCVFSSSVTRCKAELYLLCYVCCPLLELSHATWLRMVPLIFGLCSR